MLEIIQTLISVDHSVFLFINGSLANPVTDFIMPQVTLDMHLKIFFGLCLALLLWRGDRRLRLAVIFSLITVAATDLLSASLIKSMFERPRPCNNAELAPLVHLLVPCGKGFSFPSSHAANLFGQAFLFRSIEPRFNWFLIPLAILVALSRVFVGVHYPVDILVGAALGTLVGYAVAQVFMRMFPSNKSLKIAGVNHVDQG